MIFEAINGGLIADGDSADVVDGGHGLIADFDRVALVVVDGVPATADDVLGYLYDSFSGGARGSTDIDGILR